MEVQSPESAVSGAASKTLQSTQVTVGDLVLEGERRLREAGVEQARVDAELLMAHAMGSTRLETQLRWRTCADGETRERYRSLVVNRSAGRPLQYLMGSAAFRELELTVDPRVLIPRPETEELVEAVLAKNRAGAVPNGPWADVGTGSGAIALSIALEEPGVEIIGVELSQDALDVARANLAATRVRTCVQFLRASLLEAFRPASLAAVISNPPYVSTRDWTGLPREVREFEPAVALNGGVSGMRIAHELARQSACVLKPGGLLALELGEGQAPALADALARRAWFSGLQVQRDLAGKSRFLMGTRV